MKKKANLRSKSKTKTIKNEVAMEFKIKKMTVKDSREIKKI